MKSSTQKQNLLSRQPDHYTLKDLTILRVEDLNYFEEGIKINVPPQAVIVNLCFCLDNQSN